MEQKDIDRLFQEKLKDVEVTPSPAVWNAIEQKLQKKKRRVLPFWWFSGGVAAVLLLGVFLFFNNAKQPENNFPTITNEDIIEEKNKDENIENKENEVTPIVAEESIEENNNIDTHKQKIIVSKETISNEKQETSVKNYKNIQKENEKRLNLINAKIAVNEDNNESGERIEKKNLSSDEIVLNKNLNLHKEKENLNKELEIAKNDLDKEDKKSFSSPEKEEGLKQQKETEKKDFIAEMDKKNEVIKENKEEEKWAVSPIIGILSSNSFSKGSPLDTDLNDNDFSGGSTFSYGVNVTYQLHKKWALKSGVQLQRTAFTTNGVTLVSSASSSLAVNNLENVVINDDEDFRSFVLNTSSEGLASDFSVVEGEIREEGNLKQNYSYIEIPVEVKYTFFSSKKIQTSIISGFSSLILNENSIKGETSNFSSTIGEATNLNTFNFSGNLGFDLDVEISKKLNLNINPVFKAQLNTFSENSNGFSPYTIGVYTGLRYKF